MLEKLNLNDENYNVNGWTLSFECLSVLGDEILKNKNIKNIVEFGSGVSTLFLCDLIDKYGLDINIDSFENDNKFLATKVRSYLNTKVRNLEECLDEHFDFMFETQQYNKMLFNTKTTDPFTRQRNCFYEIKEDDLKDNYDLVILDGPHGNGRSIAFLHLKNKLKPGSLVLIDDHTHYGFQENLNKLFKTKTKYINDEFVLLEII